MTRIDAILTAMNIIRECEAHNENNGSCTSCPFGTSKGECLVCDGNDIPKEWRMGKVFLEAVEGL